MKKFGLFLAMFGVLVIASSPAAAQGKSDHFYASSELFGYTGIVSVYDTWADANSERNARCSAQFWPQRDGAIFVVKNAPEYYFDANLILTNWFANGGASPSNTNEGFFQLYDLDANAWQNQKASWSRDLNTFTVRGKGRNATYGSEDPMDYARLWNACAPQGSGETTKGTFLRYEYVFIATGLNGVEGPSRFITNTTNASNYSGYFRGIFHNESATSLESNGYYVFDLQFNDTSWAADNDLLAFDDEFGGKK
jgi:hypothetical protein